MGQTLALARGALTISIDLEMLWGVWDKARTDVESRCAELERQIATRLLQLFQKYEVRATWAVVGRLLDDARGFDGLRGGRDCWFAPDIVAAIRDASVAHEIGSHTYSHVYFRAAARDTVAEDMKRAADVHREHALPFVSFVFPRNQVGYLDVLRAAGIRVYRSTDAGLLHWAEKNAPKLRPALNFAEKGLGLPSPVVMPIRHDDGLIEIPSSMLLMSRDGARKLISPRALEKKVCDGVKRAAREGAVFHLWFHPSNFYFDTDVQFSILESGLSTASELRARGQLDVRTMGDYAVERAA